MIRFFLVLFCSLILVGCASGRNYFAPSNFDAGEPQPAVLAEADLGDTLLGRETYSEQDAIEVHAGF